MSFLNLTLNIYFRHVQLLVFENKQIIFASQSLLHLKYAEQNVNLVIGKIQM